jgi:hypothetical protein
MGKTLETPRKAASPKRMAVPISLALMVLAPAIAAFFHSHIISPFSLPKSTIEIIVSNQQAWENKTIMIQGTMQRIALGIIYPFNYWLFSDRNQTVRIGVSWYTESDLSGNHVIVVGIVTHDYAWVHPDHPGWQIYFIKASRVYQVS